MYFTNWDRFLSNCNTLCDTSSTLPRYTLKFNYSKSLLVIKVTNDQTCLKFKTRSTVYLNRFDAFNKTLLKRFSSSSNDTSTVTTTTTSPIQATTKEVKEELEGGDIEMSEGGTRIGESISTSTSTPGKKKKKGKKKSKP
ncbi:hypothetical protein JCM3765_006089 [Sporobolomyces pararoseus]